MTPHERAILREVTRNHMLGGSTFQGATATDEDRAAMRRLADRRLVQSQGANAFKGPEAFRLTDSGKELVLNALVAGLALAH